MKYFTKDEFKCHCCGKNEIKDELIEKLDNARDIAGIPFYIVSGYRCEKHNKEVGGVPNSAHTRGYAADIRATSSRERFIIMKALIEVGFNRIGCYENFIHADIDPEKINNVIWRHK